MASSRTSSTCRRTRFAPASTRTSAPECASVGPLRARPEGQRSQSGRDSRSSTTTTSRSSMRRLTYRLARQHALVLAVNNLFDEFYYEKLGFPLQGASFKAFYRVGF